MPFSWFRLVITAIYVSMLPVLLLTLDPRARTLTDTRFVSDLGGVVLETAIAVDKQSSGSSSKKNPKPAALQTRTLLGERNCWTQQDTYGRRENVMEQTSERIQT